MTTFVIAQDGSKLMPTFNIKKVRKMLKNGRAKICCHAPFTIQLQYESRKYTQDVELTEDTGYQNIGLSVKSEKHEFVSDTRILLKDEVEHHSKRKKYRRARRNRKRHRKPRFNNRMSTKKEGWLPPSIENKMSQHVLLLKKINAVCPITRAEIEVGQFDTQVLKAVESGNPIPEGLDYQYGERYGYDTLREAVFARDNYTCQICGKGIKENAILRIHHKGYWKNDRTNRLSNLLTVCTSCHTSKNHKPGGVLYGLELPSKNFKGAAFMNSVKWQLYEELQKYHKNVHITYGAVTKRDRLDRNIEKTHANDAYCIGKFRPKHRCKSETYQKIRRNNRVLEKFYDAKYIDIRDGSKKSGSQLSSNRTNRSEPRNSEKNERSYRGQKTGKGRRSNRRSRYDLQPNDIVRYEGKKYRVVGAQNKGAYVKLSGLRNPVRAANTELVYHAGGWVKINDN